MSRPRFAVGLGCRSKADTAGAVAAVKDALAGLDGEPIGLYTVDRRAGDAALLAAAARLGLRLTGFPPAKLATRSADAVTRSERVEAAVGVPSVAETAALVGAGSGSRLVVPRQIHGGVTVAVAQVLEGP